MPIGYLITAALIGFAVAQPRRPRLLAKLSWLTGPVFNELPAVVGLVLAIGTPAAIDGAALARRAVGWWPRWPRSPSRRSP